MYWDKSSCQKSSPSISVCTIVVYREDLHFDATWDIEKRCRGIKYRYNLFIVPIMNTCWNLPKHWFRTVAFSMGYLIYTRSLKFSSRLSYITTFSHIWISDLVLEINKFWDDKYHEVFFLAHPEERGKRPWVIILIGLQCLTV